MPIGDPEDDRSQSPPSASPARLAQPTGSNTNYNMHPGPASAGSSTAAATTRPPTRLVGTKHCHSGNTPAAAAAAAATTTTTTTAMGATSARPLRERNTVGPLEAPRCRLAANQQHDNDRRPPTPRLSEAPAARPGPAKSQTPPAVHRLSAAADATARPLYASLVVITIVVAYFGYPAECSASLSGLQLAAAPTTPSSCPLARDCTCKWVNGKQAAYCERRNLHTIPMQLPPDTQVLDMGDNNLIQLPAHIFRERHLINLQKLFLAECKISYIADEAFAHLHNLIELDLSHNLLQQVPTKALDLLKGSIRRLTLSHNMIHVLDSAAFSPLGKLTYLDLSNNQMTTMKSNAFHGLGELSELKISENRLTQLPTNVVSDLREFIVIELFGNPWHCDCELRASIEWMQRHHISQQALNPTCASPARHKDIRWQSIKPDDFMCPPVIINKQNELVVGAGSNVTLACTARGSAPLTFVWFQDEKNLTGRKSDNLTENPPPSTNLLEEKRYEIAEELGPPNVTTSILYLMNLKITDTSLFLCWVENSAGYTLGNFSLIVNDSPPAHLNGNGAAGPLEDFMRLLRLDTSDTTNALISLCLILILAVAFVCLLVFRRMLGPSQPPKYSSPSELKAQQAGGKLSAANKFNQVSDNGNAKPTSRMFASSDEDNATDEDEDANSSSAASTGSASSCRKTAGQQGNPKVLAVNDLDGFIEHMRSGIINMDYHTMSPVIQFNNTLKKGQPTADLEQLQTQQLSQLNHFPTASNSSTQPLFYNNKQPSNGSMATTLSDLSPSSGSASTSFATTTNLAHVPQQQYLGGTLRRQMAPSSMAQYSQQIHQQQQPDIAAAAYPIDYQGGYNIGVSNMNMHPHPQHQHQQQHLFMPPMYDFDPTQMYNHQEQLLAAQHRQQQVNQSSRPNSMNMQEESYHQQPGPGGFHGQIQDSPNFL